MSQPSEELLFFGDNIEESEQHLIEGGGFRASTDGPGLAFPFTATRTVPQPTGIYYRVDTSNPAVSPGLNAPVPIFDRPSSLGESPCGDGNSPALLAPSNAASLEFASPRNAPSPFLTLQDSSSSGYDFDSWANPEASLFFDFDTNEPAPFAIPETLNIADSAVASDYSGTTHQAPDQPRGSVNIRESPSIGKRPEAIPQLQQDLVAYHSSSRPPGRSLLAANPIVGPSNAGSGEPQSKPKLRSASRSSKNVVHRPDETSDERKTRNAHNLVEKQYRNRLNAQFEALLSVLPGSLYSPAGNTGFNNSELNTNLGERRLSKGDVLELSTRYIRTLEKTCKRLERERDELGVELERVRSKVVGPNRPRHPDE